jgi:hypothetical protein
MDSVLDYARAVFELSKTDDKGISNFEHLSQVEQQTGITPRELEVPEIPPIIEYIWEVFIEVSSGRSAGLSGPSPISHQEIHSWSILTGITLTSFEVNLLKKIDSIYVRTNNGG